MSVAEWRIREEMLRAAKRARFAKVCLLGDMGVGKTSLAQRYVEGDFFGHYRPSYQVNHYEKSVSSPDLDYNLLIWDTAGTERFRALTSHYIRGCTACLLVFDVTDRETYKNVIEYWLPKSQEWQPGLPAILVGNKVDLAEWRGWAVSLKEIITFCSENRLRFYETSARTGQNVEKCFLDAGNITGETPYLDSEGDGFLDSFQLTAYTRGLHGAGRYLGSESQVKELWPKDQKKKSVLDCCVIL